MLASMVSIGMWVTITSHSLSLFLSLAFWKSVFALVKSLMIVIWWYSAKVSTFSLSSSLVTLTLMNFPTPFMTLMMTEVRLGISVLSSFLINVSFSHAVVPVTVAMSRYIMNFFFFWNVTQFLGRYS